MIKINGTEYDAQVVDALDGSMKITLVTDLGLDDIENMFLSENPQIEVIEGGETIAKYYNKSVKSLTLTTKNGNRNVTVLLDVSKISGDAEATLTAEIETNSTALSDLAEVVSTNAETAETNGDALAELAETVSALAERVTALEEAANG